MLYRLENRAHAVTNRHSRFVGHGLSLPDRPDVVPLSLSTPGVWCTWATASGPPPRANLGFPGAGAWGATPRTPTTAAPRAPACRHVARVTLVSCSCPRPCDDVSTWMPWMLRLAAFVSRPNQRNRHRCNCQQIRVLAAGLRRDLESGVLTCWCTACPYCRRTRRRCSHATA